MPCLILERKKIGRNLLPIRPHKRYNPGIRFLLAGFGYTLSWVLFKASGTILGEPLSVQGGTLELSGVLTLTGNLILNAGGTLQVDIGDPTEPDPWGSVNVTGTATLGGTLTVKLKNGLPPAQSRPIITTTGGAVGNFATVPAGWQINKVNNNKTVELQKL